MADVTGNDILANTGNAALGGGYTPNGVPFLNTDPLANLEGTMKQLQEENANWNAMLYKQKIADRDSLIKTMAGNTIDGDVLDSDREVLQKKLDDIKNIMVNNPDKVFTDPNVYAKFQSASNDFKSMAAAAKTRYGVIKNIQQEAANETNPTVRDDMNNYITQQINGGINHVPNPYPKLYTYDINKIWPNMPVETKITGYTNKNGIGYAVNQTKADTGWLKKIYDYFTVPNLQQNNGELLNQLLIFNKGLQSPVFANPANVSSINARLDQINKELNLPADNPLYLQPVGVVNGSDVTLNQDPVAVARAMTAIKNYQNKTEELPNKEAQAAYKSKSDIAQSYASASESSAKAHEINAKLPYEIEQLKEKNQALGGVTNAQALSGYNGYKAISDLSDYHPVADIQGKTKGALDKYLQDQFGTTDMEARIVPVTNQAAINAMTTQVADPLGKQVIQKPAMMIAVRQPNDPAHPMILGFDKDGNITKTIANADDMIIGVANFNNKFKGNVAEQNKAVAAGKQLQQADQNQPQVRNDRSVLSSPEEIRQLPNGEKYYRKNNAWYDGQGNYLGPAKNEQ